MTMTIDADYRRATGTLTQVQSLCFSGIMKRSRQFSWRSRDAMAAFPDSDSSIGAAGAESLLIGCAGREMARAGVGSTGVGFQVAGRREGCRSRACAALAALSRAMSRLTSDQVSLAVRGVTGLPSPSLRPSAARRGICAIQRMRRPAAAAIKASWCSLSHQKSVERSGLWATSSKNDCMSEPVVLRMDLTIAFCGANASTQQTHCRHALAGCGQAYAHGRHTRNRDLAHSRHT